MDCMKRILIIEDDSHVCAMMADVLELQGYTITVANSGKEALAQLRRLTPKPCAILLDLMMPEMNGWQFLDHHGSDADIRDIPVIVCSAYHESARAIRPAAVLNKPVQLDDLLTTLDRFCA